MSTKQAEVDELKKDEDIQRALEQTVSDTTKPGKKKQKVESKDRLWLGIHFLLFVGSAFLYYLIRLGFFGLSEATGQLLQRVTLGVTAIVLTLMLGAITKAYFIQPLSNNVARYNLNRVTNLFVGLSIFFSSRSPSFLPIGIPQSYRSV